jgi:hypothetical protein
MKVGLRKLTVTLLEFLLVTGVPQKIASPYALNNVSASPNCRATAVHELSSQADNLIEQ